MTALRWFTVVGLLLDLGGAIILLRALIVSRSQALELGMPRWAADSEDENLKLPQVRDRLNQSRNAKNGLVLLILGFVFQLVGSFAR